MAIDEQARHALYEAFKASHGNEVATTLMELLPPVGWGDVATKHDLRGLEERMDLRFQLVDQKFEWLEARLGERLEAGLREQMTRFWVALVAVSGVSIGLAQAISRLG